MAATKDTPDAPSSIFLADRSAASVCREGQAGALSVREHLVCNRIVEIYDTLVGNREQLGLGLAVGLHGLMEVQMILSQVGERANGEAHAAHAVEYQRVRRDFHDAVRAASLGHACKQRRGIVGLGRGALGRDDLVADHVLIGADQADLTTLGFQNVLDQRGGRGLAVGTGHADHGELARGMVEAVARDVGRAPARHRGR